MKATTYRMKDNAIDAMANPALQDSLDRMKTGFSSKRAIARDRLPEFDVIRAATSRTGYSPISTIISKPSRQR